MHQQGLESQGILTMDQKFSVYIMSKRSGTLYIGVTNDMTNACSSRWFITRALTM